MPIRDLFRKRVIANPFRKRICPSCGNEYYLGNCAIISDSPTSKGTVLKSVTKNFFSRIFVRSLKGRAYTRQLARFQCPTPACNKLLPRLDTFTIAIVGDSQAGKSHFIASCIDLLKKRETWQVLACSYIVGQDKTDQTYYEKYYEPVYIKKEAIKPTPPSLIRSGPVVLDPLIYEIVFRKKTRGSSSKSITLLFYDSSGEDLNRQDRLVAYGHYVLDARAVIFLADPLLMPGILKELPSSLLPPPPPPGEIQMRTFDVLGRVIQTLRERKGLKPGKQLDIPIAITVSKSDLLRIVRHDALFLKPAVLSNRIDLQHFEIIDREVRDLLQEFGDNELLAMSDAFKNKIFLAVSPTGWSSDGSGKFPKIEPLRCFDPVLWAFWKLGIINNV